jgi:hypothetical protein
MVETIGCFIGVVYLVITALINGVAIQVIWNNFVAYNFDVPEISIVIALAMALLIGLMSPHNVSSSESDSTEKKVLSALSIATRPLFALILAWILLLFR